MTRLMFLLGAIFGKVRAATVGKIRHWRRVFAFGILAQKGLLGMPISIVMAINDGDYERYDYLQTQRELKEFRNTGRKHNHKPLVRHISSHWGLPVEKRVPPLSQHVN